MYESETKRGEAKYRQAGMNDVYPTGAMSSPRERSIDTVAKASGLGRSRTGPLKLTVRPSTYMSYNPRPSKTLAMSLVTAPEIPTIATVRNGQSLAEHWHHFPTSLAILSMLVLP